MLLSPDQPQTDATQWHQESQTHLAAGRFAEAAVLLSRLVMLVPDNDLYWTALASAHFGQGVYDKAVEAGLKAVDLMSVSLPAWTILADAFAATGQWEEALTAAVQQFELHPVVPDGLFKAAVAHAQLEDAEGAVRALEAALSQRRDVRVRLSDPCFDAIRSHAGFQLLLN